MHRGLADHAGCGRTGPAASQSGTGSGEAVCGGLQLGSGTTRWGDSNRGCEQTAQQGATVNSSQHSETTNDHQAGKPGAAYDFTSRQARSDPVAGPSEKEMVVFQGSIPVPVQDDEVVIDHVTAPEDAPMSSLLASREVSPGGGKLPKAAGIFPPLDLGLALQSEKPVAQSGAPDQEQATSPLGLRKRRCVKGLGLLDLPRNAREEDRGFYVGGIGNQASSPEAAHNGSSQLQASGPEELWKQFKRAPTTSTSTMFLLLVWRPDFCAGL